MSLEVLRTLIDKTTNCRVGGSPSSSGCLAIMLSRVPASECCCAPGSQAQTDLEENLESNSTYARR